jgi:dUTP pyrophosphatase
MQYVKLDKEAPDLAYAKIGDAGIDLTARHFISLAKFGDPEGHDKYLMPTGIAVKIPEGHFGLIVPRSSSAKLGIMLANTCGIIDSGYTGELLVFIRNMTGYPLPLERGSRIAQLIVLPYFSVPKFELVEKLPETDRGSGGFGSTGV